MSEKNHSVPVAVVGAGAIMPGSTDIGGFWRDILAGRDLVTDIPETHWLIQDYYDPNPSAPDKTYAKRGAFLPKVDFDPMSFGVPPNIVPATDTAQLLALIVAQQVLEDAAQGQFASMDREKMSVILGVTSAQELMLEMTSRLQRPQWLKGLREAGIPEEEAQKACDLIAKQYTPWQEATFPGLLGNVVAGRIANRFDLRGTNTVTDAACASALSALSMALNELYTGQSDVVIAGGVDTMNDISMYVCFSKTPALSKTGDCRPFSASADGTLLGEGLAMLALKRLDDAERDGDRIYAVIRALGSSSDGRGPSVYAPLPAGQARALRRTYEKAGYGPDTVELVEAHGTGTVAGDAAEFEGLRTTFDETGRQDRQWCALGSVKSQIGHTKASAGAAGMFKAVMALHHKVLPPTIKIDKPNPKIDIGKSPFYLNTKARPWVRDASHPRRASVSSFGFGGSNFHVALEEYTGGGKKQWKIRSMPAELVLLSGADGAAVARACKALDAADVAKAARATQLAFDRSQPARLAIVATSADDLAKKLADAVATITKAPTTAFSTPSGVHYAVGQEPGKVAFLFPGQGSQYVEMGADVAMAFDEARAAWDAAAGVAFDGKTVGDVVFPKPVFDDEARDAQAKELTRTEWAQPAIGVASLALLGVLRAVGAKADATAGHSFGEITALAAAGAIDTDGVVRIARKRGELMRDAAKSTRGAMTAVAAPIEQVREAITRIGANVVVANHNSPSQVVLSGAMDAIDRAEEGLAKIGAACRRLPVATAFHSPLVAGSCEPFEAFLRDVPVRAPGVPVYANATAAVHAGEPDAIRKALAAQIASPVRFVDEIEAMYAAGVRTFVEVGPGSVLTELVGRILGNRPHVAIATDRKGKHGVASLWEALGRMAVAGVALDLQPLWAAYAPPAEAKAKKPGMALGITGANYGKPYPPEGGAKALPKPNPSRVAPAPAPGPAPAPASKAPAAVTTSAPAPTSAPATSALPATPVTASVVASAPMARTSEPSLAWVKAYQDAQRQTAEAHAAYQRAMAESHMAFLRTVESSFAGLAAMQSGAPLAATLVAAPVPVPAPAPVPAPQPSAPPVVAAPPAVVAAPAPVLPAAKPAPVAPKAAPAAPKAAAVDLEGLMMAVVAEKTGYPAEMLGMHMELEGDLGIDSIKRVEILSTMREKAPGLPEVDAGEMAQLRTLGQIVDYMRSAAGAPAAASAPAHASSGTAPAVDLQGLMLSVVAEKTGYPAEMLGLHMELEGDLGIDSIKRVEILSTMRERAPGLPEVDAGEMAQLRTLGQIVEYMTAHGAVSAPPSAVRPPPSAEQAAPGVDLQGLMMAVVAEKTGYPAEMLGLHMELEGDLGIDSIKRVEILSTMRERAPGLPEVDAGQMAQLRTLGQIVDYMKAQGAGSAPAAAAPSAPAADGGQRKADGGSSVDLQGLMMAVVAEKTGYPADMLGLHMELEGDLGIDSIKRVEILSTMRERAPGLPEVDAGQMAQLRTLGQIVDYMREQGAGTPAPAAPADGGRRTADGAMGVDLTGLMMSVVAEKTGYPADMLGLHMELEGDLGIDSIKRVEILSTMRERAPGLPEVDAGQMAQLRTLGQIVDYMKAQGAGADVESGTGTGTGTGAGEKGSDLRGSHHEVDLSIHRFVVREVDASPVGLAMPGLTGTKVAVTDEGTGVGAAVVAKLAERGVQASLVTKVPADAGAVVFLGGLRDVNGVDDAIRVNGEAFQAAKAVASKFGVHGGTFVTVQDTGGDFGLTGKDGTRAWAGGVSALARTVAQEWPKARIKAIDLERAGRSADVLADALVAELLQGGTTLEVGLHADGRRTTLASVDHAVQKDAVARVTKDSVVVASGGARGVTAATLIALAKAHQPKIVLLGRTGLDEEPAAVKGVTDDAGLKKALMQVAIAAGKKPTPAEIGASVSRIQANREVRATIAAMESAGSKVRYVACDVQDAAAVSSALDAVREDWGAPTVIVHGAGVLADKLVAEKTAEQFQRVFDTKVLGLRALLAATANDPIAALILFSSVAARTGNVGQSDYAMANEVLNLVGCAERARRGILVRSIGWGPWEGGMVTPGLKAKFEAMGVALIPLDTGARMLVEELDGTTEDVEIVIGGAVGEGALGASAEKAVSLEVRIDQRSHPYLADHTIAGTPVVPVVMAMEWFARAARACRPDLHVAAIRDLKVLRGIKLDHYENGGDKLVVSARQLSNGDGAILAVELRGAKDALHYSATVEMTERPVAAPRVNGTPSLDAYNDTVYDGHVLFHGPDFQAIRALDGVSKAGIAGTLAGARELGWAGDAWRTDPAANDGALQLAVLWAKHVLGGASLPMSVASYHSYADGLPEGPIRCIVTGRQVGDSRAVSDIALADTSGRVIAEMRGVETILRPGEKATRAPVARA